MKEVTKQKESTWIDVHDDNVMREMGFLRPFLQTPRDKSVWTKTPQEHRAIKKVKYSSDMHFHSIPTKIINVPGKLIIQLKKNKSFPKTTYSIECIQSDIPRIVSKFVVKNNKLKTFENIISKYTWNGKTYQYGELPFWGK